MVEIRSLLNQNKEHNVGKGSGMVYCYTFLDTQNVMLSSYFYERYTNKIEKENIFLVKYKVIKTIIRVTKTLEIADYNGKGKFQNLI